MLFLVGMFMCLQRTY